jgi:hypothetical protein
MNFGDTYVVDAKGRGTRFEGKPIPPSAPGYPNCFGFRNFINVAPVLMVGSASDPETVVDAAQNAGFSDDPENAPTEGLKPDQPVWLAGRGTLSPEDYTPPSNHQIALWFESESLAEAMVKTRDRSNWDPIDWRDEQLGVDEDGFLILVVTYVDGEFTSGNVITEDGPPGDDTPVAEGGDATGRTIEDQQEALKKGQLGMPAPTSRVHNAIKPQRVRSHAPVSHRVKAINGIPNGNTVR